MSVAMSASGFLLTAVRAYNKCPILWRSVRTLQRSTRHISSKMPKKGRGKDNTLDPLSLPPQLQTALEALYGHYENTFEVWQKDGTRVPPELCRVAEKHPKVRAYVKNHSLGFEVPYRFGSEIRMYHPDFIVLVDDGHEPHPDGTSDLLHLVIEIKGHRRKDAKEKKLTMDTYWIPGVNNLGTYGRWTFAAFTDVYEIQSDFKTKIEGKFDAMISQRSGQMPIPVGISVISRWLLLFIRMFSLPVRKFGRRGPSHTYGEFRSRKAAVRAVVPLHDYCSPQVASAERRTP